LEARNMKIHDRFLMILSVSLALVHAGCAAGQGGLDPSSNGTTRSLVIGSFSFDREGEDSTDLQEIESIEMRIRRSDSHGSKVFTLDEKGYLLFLVHPGEYEIVRVRLKRPGAFKSRWFHTQCPFHVPENSVIYLGDYVLRPESTFLHFEKTAESESLTGALDRGRETWGPGAIKARTVQNDIELDNQKPIRTTTLGTGPNYYDYHSPTMVKPFILPGGGGGSPSSMPRPPRPGPH